MAVLGDFPALAELKKRLASIGDAKFRRDVAQALGAVALKLVDDGFRSGRDPYGKAWPPPKFRTGAPMTDTGRTAASFSHRADDRGFTVGSSARHLATHQAESFVITAKNAKALRIPVRGAPTKSRPRGKLSYLFFKSVRTVQRLVMPDPKYGLPMAWGEAFNNEAAEVMRDHLEGS